jgi:kinesin family member 15
VASEETSQDDLFENVGKQIVTACLLGYNGSIFAYGQTGSGKTHTIQGGPNNARGLLPRSFEYLFKEISKINTKHLLKQEQVGSLSKGIRARKSDHLYNQEIFSDERVSDISFDVQCSFIEIYNETIYDLLDGQGQKLHIREDKGITFLESCTQVHVKNSTDVLELIQRGQDYRHVAATNMNLESSRSHAVFTALIKIVSTHKDGQRVLRTSRFHIVDLAGSERVKDTNADGQRLKELCKINTSLSVLGKVIFELSENSRGESSKKTSNFVNFR